MIRANNSCRRVQRLALAVLATGALFLVAGVALGGIGITTAGARLAPVKKTRCFTTSGGDRICLKYDCRGSRCVKTHRCDRRRGTRAMVCTSVAARVSSNGLGCSTSVPPYYYHYDVWQPLGDKGNDPYHIGVTLDRKLPVPDGFEGRMRISWSGKHGGAICLAKVKTTGPGWEVRCSAGPCDPDLPTIRGDGYFDVRARPRPPDDHSSRRAEVIIRGA